MKPLTPKQQRYGDRTSAAEVRSGLPSKADKAVVAGSSPAGHPNEER